MCKSVLILGMLWHAEASLAQSPLHIEEGSGDSSIAELVQMKCN